MFLSLIFQVSQTCSFLKKEIPTQVFSCEFCTIFKNTFTEQLRWLHLQRPYYISVKEILETANSLQSQMFDKVTSMPLLLRSTCLLRYLVEKH